MACELASAATLWATKWHASNDTHGTLTGAILLPPADPAQRCEGGLLPAGAGGDRRRDDGDVGSADDGTADTTPNAG